MANNSSSTPGRKARETPVTATPMRWVFICLWTGRSGSLTLGRFPISMGKIRGRRFVLLQRTTPCEWTVSARQSPPDLSPWKHLPEVRVDLWKVGETFAFFQGRHTGYRRLPVPVIHHRSVFYVKSRLWLIRDVAEGAGDHQLDLFWHLAPRLQLNARVGSAFLFGTNDRSGLALVAAEGHQWSERVTPGWYSPVYGQKEPAPVLHFSTSSLLPAGFTTLLLPLEEQAMVGRLVPASETIQPNLYSCTYDEDAGAHRWVFSEGLSPWQVGPIESDARALYCRFDSKRAADAFCCL